MSKVLLTGIGNALVDAEFSVTEEELARFGIKKGAMTLTEPSRQAEILDALGDRESHRSSGGSAGNSIMAFAQFGGSAGFISVLGSDKIGRFYADEFRNLGIILHADERSGLDTGTCIVLITPDGERTLNTTLAANVTFGRRDVDEAIVKNSEWLLLEGYKLTEETGADALEYAAFVARKNNARVAVSCSDGFVVDVFGDRLKTILKHADMVFCNEHEAMALAQESNVRDAYRSLRSTYGNVAVTLGEHGSMVSWFGREATIPAYAVDTVDTTGAGDMYAGAFLYGVLHGHHPEHAGRLASYCSARVVAQYGARLKVNHIEVRDAILHTSPTIES